MYKYIVPDKPSTDLTQTMASREVRCGTGDDEHICSSQELGTEATVYCGSDVCSTDIHRPSRPKGTYAGGKPLLKCPSGFAAGFNYIDGEFQNTGTYLQTCINQRLDGEDTVYYCGIDFCSSQRGQLTYGHGARGTCPVGWYPKETVAASEYGGIYTKCSKTKSIATNLYCGADTPSVGKMICDPLPGNVEGTTPIIDDDPQGCPLGFHDAGKKYSFLDGNKRLCTKQK